MAGHVIFDKVSKRFNRGMEHDSLRDLIPSLIRRLGGNAKDRNATSSDSFWAVKNVSFEVKPGQALGIIGGNGAGKSTTLKLLTRILAPTSGSAELSGRVGALIEVSAGFHPDLTGRENVFLQGAIMGMPIRLIRERFDEIVAFSGIETFIDMPVKRYSSGMNARLGFSIAAHLEPDVLIIDEVLSVGDAEFQQRAFSRIREMVRGNIPVVIVSHQLDRVVELCSHAILLVKGEAVAEGAPGEVVQRYLGGGGAHSVPTPFVGGARITAITIPTPNPVQSGSSMTFAISGDRLDDLPEWVEVAIAVRNSVTTEIVFCVTHKSIIQPGGRSAPRFDRLTLDANLPAGTYLLESTLNDEQAGVKYHGPSVIFEVVSEAACTGSAHLFLRES